MAGAGDHRPAHRTAARRIVNGACYGGKRSRFQTRCSIVPGTNFVPRMSNGVELQVILPIVNAPFRIFYAYNPMRLYKDVPQQLAVPNSGPGNTFQSYFPNSGAGQFTYQAGVAVLRRELHAARTAKDVPVNGQHDVLKMTVKSRRHKTTAGPSTPHYAIKLREAPHLRLIDISIMPGGGYSFSLAAASSAGRSILIIPIMASMALG